MLQVYEDKQRRCELELELEELRQGCATRMQVASQKAQRAQQVLQLQVYQLQQEKSKLQEDFAHVLKEREQLEERCTSYEHEKIQLGPRLEESKWEVRRRGGGGSPRLPPLPVFSLPYEPCVCVSLSLLRCARSQARSRY